MSELMASEMGECAPLVSVITPVFNSEKYLRQCLDSIVGQTLENIEIICVDDGSTDGSASILREYAESDSRIKLLEQPNLRAGVARNNGIELATGEYLAFWDSDDFFELTALEKLYAQSKRDDADICVCGASRIMGDIETPVEQEMYLRRKLIPDVVPFSIETNRDNILTFTNAAPWNKLFRRSFVEEQNILFSTAANSEDVYFVEVALCLAKRITVVDEALIVYRRDRPGSLTNTITDSKLSSLQVWVDTARRLRELDVYPQISFANRAGGNVAYMLRNQKNYEAFSRVVYALKESALDELSLRDTSVLTQEWLRELYDRIRDDEPEDALMYLMNYTYTKLTEASMRSQIRKNKIKALRERLRRIKERESKEAAFIRQVKTSSMYRIGSALAWLPRKVKRLIVR